MQRGAAIVALACACAACEPTGLRPAMPRGAVEVEAVVEKSESCELPSHPPEPTYVRASVWSVPTAGGVTLTGVVHADATHGMSGTMIFVDHYDQPDDKRIELATTDGSGAFDVELPGAMTYQITVSDDVTTALLSPIELADATTTHLDVTVTTPRDDTYDHGF